MGCVSKLTHKPSIPLTKSTRCSCSSACHASKGISVLLLAFCSKLKGAIRQRRWFTGEGGEKTKITKLKSFNWNVVIKFLIKKEKVCCEAEKKNVLWLSGVCTASYKICLSSFQLWWNKKQSSYSNLVKNLSTPMTPLKGILTDPRRNHTFRNCICFVWWPWESQMLFLKRKMETLFKWSIIK